LRPRGRNVRSERRGSSRTWEKLLESMNERPTSHGRRRVDRRDLFEDELPASVIERFTGSTRRGHDALAEPFRLQIEGSMLAVGVVARPAEQSMGRPGAAPHARLRVVAGLAVAPEVGLDRAVAGVPESETALPDLLQPMLPYVPPDPVAGGQGGATLDVPVRLDADHEAPGGAGRLRRRS